MSVHAKCHNYSGCLQAYRGEEIELPPGSPLVCPECGKPLTVVKPQPSAILRFIPLVAAAALVVAAFVIGRPYFSKDADKTEPAPAVAQTAVAPPAEDDPNVQNPVSAPENTDTPAAVEPPAAVIAPEQIDMDLGRTENQQVKEEVLKRIDLMPEVSTADKDKLYNSVERARSMGKVLTIPFGSGKITVGAAEGLALQEEFSKPEIMKLRDDPTAVFVILGYADPKGDEKKNLAISQARAKAVLEVLEEKIGVRNVMHSVGMGGSTLMDEKNLEKNRIAEVWAVLP